MRLCLALALVTLLLWLPPQSPTIALDPSTTYQTIVGWEATAQAGQSDFPDWNLYKHDLLDQAVADGINRLRVEMSYKTESNAPNSSVAVNDNADPFSANPAGFQWGNNNGVDSQIEVVNMIRARLAPQGEVPYVVVPYVDFNSSSSFEHHTDPEEYAELYERLFLRTATHGWVPDAVELLLESDKTSNVDWTLSTTTPNGAKLAAVLIATRNRLAQRGWFPKFILPSPTNCDKADVIYNAVKAANPAIVQIMQDGGELSYHRYTSAACTQAQLNEIVAIAAADGLAISMLERIGATYATLHTDLKAGVVAWQQFTLAYDVADDGSRYYLVNHSSHTVTISSRMKFLRQYFKYVRRGAVRIEATSSNSTFDPVAFINPDGRYVVVVKAATGGSFSIGGLPSGTYGIKYTTASAYDQNHPDQQVTGTLTTSIPAAGVLTVYGLSAASPTPTPTPSPSPSPSPSPTPVTFKLSCGGQLVNGTVTNLTCVQIP